MLFSLYNDFILNTGLSLCLRRLSCVKIYKSAQARSRGGGGGGGGLRKVKGK